MSTYYLKILTHLTLPNTQNSIKNKWLITNSTLHKVSKKVYKNIVIYFNKIIPQTRLYFNLSLGEA